MRLKCDLERLLTAFLKQQRPRPGEAIRRALKRSPGGFGIEREQPAEAGRRRRMR